MLLKAGYSESKMRLLQIKNNNKSNNNKKNSIITGFTLSANCQFQHE